MAKSQTPIRDRLYFSHAPIHVVLRYVAMLERRVAELQKELHMKVAKEVLKRG